MFIIFGVGVVRPQQGQGRHGCPQVPRSQEHIQHLDRGVPRWMTAALKGGKAKKEDFLI